MIFLLGRQAHKDSGGQDARLGEGYTLQSPKHKVGQEWAERAQGAPQNGLFGASGILWFSGAPPGRRGITFVAKRDSQVERNQGWWCPAACPRPPWLGKGRICRHQVSDPTEALPASAEPCYRQAVPGGNNLSRSAELSQVQPGAQWETACLWVPSFPALIHPDPSGSWAPSSQPIVITTIPTSSSLHISPNRFFVNGLGQQGGWREREKLGR